MNVSSGNHHTFSRKTIHNEWDSIGVPITGNFWSNIEVNIWENIGGNLWENIAVNLSGNLRNNLNDNLQDYHD